MAAPVLAHRHRVSTTTVLYAGLNAVSCFVHRLPRAFLQITLANRIDRRVRCAFGNYSQDAPTCLDVEGTDLAELIARAAPVVLGATRCGWYPPDEAVALRRRVELDRGIAVDASCWLNHRTVRRWPESSPTSDATEAALRRASSRWLAGDDSSTSTYFVNVDDVSDAMRFTMLIDAWLIPPDEAIAWMAGLERMLCAAVTAEVAVDKLDRYTDLVSRDYGQGWHRSDAGWIDLAATAEFLAGRLGGPIGLASEPNPGGSATLTAYLDGRSTPDLERLHVDIVGALPGHRTVAAPDRYVACEGSAPAGDLDRWRAMPVLHTRSSASGSTSPLEAT
jgi:hypothetical protein